MSTSSSITEIPPQSISDCKACQTIWRRFADIESTGPVDFGSFEKALSTQCPGHKPLVESFIDYIREVKDHFPRPEPDDVGIAEGYKNRSVMMTESVSKLGQFWELLLVKKDSVPDHPGIGRVLDPDWADLDVLRQWKQTCLSSHGAKCENPMKIWPTRPAWLIDVEDKCLVPGQVPGPFVALSYGHGNHAEIIIDIDTLARLQEPHALESPELSQYMTPIIKHAIYLTSAIGERYLWVDPLCIPHHGHGTTAEHFTLMGAIYASAVVTIVAADDGSESGLAGLKGVSTPRGMNQRVIPFGDEKIVVRNTGIFSLSGGLPYYDRGWTYQQYKLAQRRITFHGRELHWECQCSVYDEETIPQAETDKFVDTRLAVILAGFPDVGSLWNLITNYNEKTLRYDEETLPAISGLLSVVSRTFTGGLLYGLPEMFFERGLAWKPLWDHVNLRRRIPSERPAGTLLGPSGLPSWSWVGWHGLISNGYGEAARINHRQNWIEETIPITEWYTSQSPSDLPSQRRRIRSTWFENRDSYKDFTKPLPPGWTRHDAPATGKFRGEPHLFPDGCDKYIFKHPALPDHDEAMDAWYYPFPVADINESTPPFMPEQTQYLFCETNEGRLMGRQLDAQRNIAILRNSLGEDIGSLFLHNEESLALFPESLAEGELGLPVKLVAVCKSRRYSKTWNEEESMYGLPLRKEDYYLVLWVEWKDGVAYRLASGQVMAGEWEKLDLEKVSLILG